MSAHPHSRPAQLPGAERYDDPDELEELEERLLDELPEPVELLLELLVLDDVDDDDEEDDDEEGVDDEDDEEPVLELLFELDDDPAELLLELFEVDELEELDDEAPPPLSEPLLDAASGEVGSVVQPAASPAAITAAGAPDSSSRNWRRRVSSATSA